MTCQLCSAQAVRNSAFCSRHLRARRYARSIKDPAPGLVEDIANGKCHTGFGITPIPLEARRKVLEWKIETDRATIEDVREWQKEARRAQEVRNIVKYHCEGCCLRYLPSELYNGLCEDCWEELRQRDIDALRGRERKLVGASTCPKCSSKLTSDGTCFRCRETALTEGRRDSL